MRISNFLSLIALSATTIAAAWLHFIIDAGALPELLKRIEVLTSNSLQTMEIGMWTANPILYTIILYRDYKRIKYGF